MKVYTLRQHSLCFQDFKFTANGGDQVTFDQNNNGTLNFYRQGELLKTAKNVSFQFVENLVKLGWITENVNDEKAEEIADSSDTIIADDSEELQETDGEALIEEDLGENAQGAKLNELLTNGDRVITDLSISELFILARYLGINIHGRTKKAESIIEKISKYKSYGEN